MRVVVAPDKFRGSLTAPEAAAAIREGLQRVEPAVDVDVVPVADGGEGTVAAAVAAGFTPVAVAVTGPTGDVVDALFAVNGDTAVIEMAQASGLGVLPRGPNPGTALSAGSFGTGQLVAAALDAGATRIVVGVGGSASTDGGAGLAAALGIRFRTAEGRPIQSGGVGLRDVATIDVTGLDPRLCTTELIIATDVDNRLLGAHGAAHVYAPQKGADPAAVQLLEQGLGTLAAVIAATTQVDVRTIAGGGAAGGIAASAVGLLGATLASGSDLLLRLVGLPAKLAGATLVITGEGSLDSQSLRGKAPHAVARLAAAHSVPVVAIVGRSTVTQHELDAAGIAQAYSIAAIETDPARQMAQAAELVSTLAERAAQQWLRDPGGQHTATAGAPSDDQ